MSAFPSIDQPKLRALSRRLGAHFLKHDLRVTTAESCTGGWIAKLLTDIPGSSAWVEAGLVTYSNAAKQTLLGVSASVLARRGAVSRDTALAMAHGALVRTSATLSVAVTGIAGPAGGVPGKPVGTVWIAWAGRGGAQRVRRFAFTGNRDAVRRQSAYAALIEFEKFLTSSRAICRWAGRPPVG